MESRQIFCKLNEHLKIVQKHYPPENIFGIFVIEQGEDYIKSEAVIVPTFEEVCTSVKSITTNLTEDIAIYDAREIYRASANGHPEIIQSLYTEYRIVNPIYEHTFQKAYVKYRDKFSAGIRCNIPATELKVALMRLCRHCWEETSNIVRFVKQLTDAEKLALNGIANKVGDEGIFSQAKLASEIGISRLTMSNIIIKMKFNNIAEIEYLGNKGTYIKFIDDSALNIYGHTV